MNWDLVFAVVGGISTVVVSVATWSYAAGGDKQKALHLATELDKFKAEVNRRFEQAGKETSDAWSYVQGIESKFIREFAPRDLTDERFAENRRDHERFTAELERRSHRR